jgi:arsenate reductase
VVAAGRSFRDTGPLCAEEICPIFPGNVKRIHWPLPDPSNSEYSSDEQLKLFRNVRDDLKDKIQGLRNEVKSWKK